MSKQKRKIFLKQLDWDDPLRNTPLIQIHVYHRYIGETVWRPITPQHGIANDTFNNLSTTWTAYSDWAIM